MFRKKILELGKESTPLLTETQREFLQKQWSVHQHKDFEKTFDVSGFGDLKLTDFLVNQGVWNPFRSSSARFARWLAHNTYLYQNKRVIEIGCGTGLLGLIMDKCGAKNVILSDISQIAVANACKNIEKFSAVRCETRVSDLFENITEQADLIFWNIPFFPGEPPAGDSIAASMLMTYELFERFLKGAKEHLLPDGVIVLPSFHDCYGHTFKPLEAGKGITLPSGYKTKTIWRFESRTGIQQGMLSMTEIKLRR